MKEAQIAVVWFTYPFITVQRYNPLIFHNVMRQVLAAADWMTPDFGCKECDISNHIHHPLGVWLLLPYPFEYVKILHSVTDLSEITSVTYLEWGIKGLVLFFKEW